MIDTVDDYADTAAEEAAEYERQCENFEWRKNNSVKPAVGHIKYDDEGRACEAREPEPVKCTCCGFVFPRYTWAHEMCDDCADHYELVADRSDEREAA